MKKSLSILFAMTLFVACKGEDKKENQDEGETPEESTEKQGAELDPGQEFAAEGLQEEIAEIEKALAAGEEVSTTSCGAISGHAETLAGVENEAIQAALEKATTLCEHDVPLATAETAVKEAEVARKANPDKEPLSECFNGSLNQAFETLEAEHPEDEAYLELKKRFEAVCPPKE